MSAVWLSFRLQVCRLAGMALQYVNSARHPDANGAAGQASIFSLQRSDVPENRSMWYLQGLGPNWYTVTSSHSVPKQVMWPGPTSISASHGVISRLSEYLLNNDRS